MNIKYATSDVQNTKVFGKYSIDDVFEKFVDVLGNNILVLDIEKIEENTKIQVQNLDYDKKFIVEINKLRDHGGSTNEYDIVISDEQKTYYVRYWYQYNWHGYSVQKIDENYIKEDVLVRRKTFSIKAGYITYIVIKDNKTLYITLPSVNNQIINTLLEIQNIDLKEIYNLLKDIDNNLVLNLSIKVVDELSKFKECISINDGSVNYYNKEYLENDTLVILEYKDNEVIVTKVNVYEGIKLDINNLDSELEKAKIKNLIRN